jgi:hypothetical protein
MDTSTIDKLRREIAERKVVVVVGAGVSIGASGNTDVASWSGLLRNGVQRCLDRGRVTDPGWAARVLAQIDGDVIDLLCAAENISQRLGAPEDGEYASWLEDTVGVLKNRDEAVLKALGELQVPFATTNYDDLIEDATGLHPVTWQDERQVDSFVRDKSEKVLHLHGHWERPETVILGIRSYENILRDEHAQNTLQTLLRVKTLLFVGFGSGLADPNFGALLRWSGRVLRKSVYPAYHLCLNREGPDINLQHREHRIQAVPYGETHSDLCGFLRGLCS